MTRSGKPGDERTDAAGPAGAAAEAPENNQHSLEGVHGTIEVPHHEAGFWQQWRAFVGPAILVSVGYMDPGNWGTDLQGGAQFKYGLLWVVGRGQPDGDLHAGDCGAAGSGDRQGPGAVLPRLVSGVDAVAELADERGGDRRLRPGRSAGLRGGAEPDVPHSAAVGGDHYGAGRAAAAGAAAVRDAHHRGRSWWCWWRPLRFATLSSCS